MGFLVPPPPPIPQYTIKLMGERILNSLKLAEENEEKEYIRNINETRNSDIGALFNLDKP